MMAALRTIGTFLSLIVIVPVALYLWAVDGRQALLEPDGDQKSSG
jgi:hypothetical protein